MRLLLPLALLALAAAPLRAETYKWVDANGVTNYSSTPPAGAAKAKAKVIEERVSVVASDPSLAPAIADMRAQAMRRAEYIEIEWLQRQRLMVEQARAVPADYCPYRADCDGWYAPYVYPYYGPYYGVRGIRGIRGVGPGVMPVVARGMGPGAMPVGARGMAPAPRGAQAGGGRR
jgi:hypothetical protein